MLPNLAGEAAAHAQRRLDDTTIIWLTTVGPGGQPQTSPVGYVWDGSRFLIVSAPGTPKVRNLRANPKVAMHLDLDTTSEDYSVLTIEGVAELDPAPAGRPAPLSEEERSAYVDRHREAIDSAGLTPEEAFTELSTVVRVKPTRARAY